MSAAAPSAASSSASYVRDLRELCGDGDRDETRVDDYAFSGRSRVTYVAQHLGFSAMMADAAMV